LESDAFKLNQNVVEYGIGILARHQRWFFVYVAPLFFCVKSNTLRMALMIARMAKPSPVNFDAVSGGTPRLALWRRSEIDG